MTDTSTRFVGFCERFLTDLISIAGDIYDDLTAPISTLISETLPTDIPIISTIIGGLASIFGSYSIFELMFSVGLPTLLAIILVKFLIGVIT